MPKKLTAILVIAMMLISSLTVGATEGKPTFVTNSVTASAGEEVEITIGLKNNPGIASIKLSVVFPEELILNKVTYNNAELGGMSQKPKDLTSPLTLNWFNGSEDSFGDCVFATLLFKVDDNAKPGTYDIMISYEQNNVYNIAEEFVEFDVENGKVEVQCLHDEDSLSYIDAKKPTCVETGYTSSVFCNDCQTYLVESEEIPATGEHKDNNLDESCDFCGTDMPKPDITTPTPDVTTPTPDVTTPTPDVTTPTPDVTTPTPDVTTPTPDVTTPTPDITTPTPDVTTPTPDETTPKPENNPDTGDFEVALIFIGLIVLGSVALFFVITKKHKA